MFRKTLVFLTVCLLSFTLWGCGSNRDSGGDQTSPDTTVADAQNLGNDNCLTCHSALTHTEFSGVARINPDPSGLASAITHDCEACHGGGQFHYGTGPIPYPSPDGERCAECHEQAAVVLASKHNAEQPENVEMIADGHDTGKCQRCHTAEGAYAFAQVIGEKTAYDVITSENDLPNLDAEGNAILHNPTCAACHNPLTKEMVTIEGWDPNNNGTGDQFDLCTSCHVYQLADGTLIGSGLSLADGTTTAPFYHNTAWYRVLSSTHYDNPGTPAGQGSGFDNPVEGYVIRKDGENPCFDCHGHNLLTNTGNLSRQESRGYQQNPDNEPTIYTDWSKSAHAGGLLNAKYAVQEKGNRNEAGDLLRDDVMTKLVADAAVKDEPIGNAWVHYNWDSTLKADGTNDRASCQMCHTATGASNFLSDPANYDPSVNDFSHLSGWSATGGSPQNELLYCWACHSNAGEGELRTPGAITLAYTVDGVNPTLPDLGDSNVCVNCHSGRGNMDSLIGAATADPAGAAVTGGTKTHYLTAGGIINQDLTRIGYEYGDVDNNTATDDYADKGYYAHNTLGCAECHMNSENSHSLEVVERDSTDTIIAISSTKCVECHDGEHALFVSDAQVGDVHDIWNGTTAVPTTVTQTMADDAAAELEHEAHGYHNALDALAAALTAAGTTPTDNYPYFSGSATDQGHGGAMHNYSLLHHEAGAYAHNRYYSKRLIFDSIDWLTSGAAGSRSLDGSITLDPVAYAAAIEWLGGDTVTGVIAMRP